ncbi:tyrosine phosphatase family-domain-containing protein [Lipomyces arxii]|uniref:tyrosine phosphatase family-domain-containing protein n=1 Tax=Lipomyces arxii TaxID=56418 RepID=UPI0034CE85DA
MSDRPVFIEEQIEVPFSLPSTSNSGAIVGILTAPSHPSYPKSVLVLMHGFAGHKNYCYQKMLAHRLAQSDLGLYSFRFDFRGCGESAEIESPNGRTLDEDYYDIRDVLKYVREQLQLYVLALVAHSRGAVAALMYAAKYDPTIPNLINCSGRFRTEQIKERVAKFSRTWEEDGGYWVDIPRYMKTQRVWVPAEETLSLAEPNMNEIATLPNSTSFLTVYGLSDVIVAVKDSEMFANLLGDRHTLKFIPDADHNFYSRNSETGVRINHNPEVVKIIAQWISAEERRKRFLYRSGWLSTVSRWKNVDGVMNFRDFGGWQTPTGHYVRPGYLLRAASLNGITEQGKRVVNKLNAKKSFDLRSSSECEQNGIYNIPGLERVHVPVGADKDMSPEQIARVLDLAALGSEGFLTVYREFLTDGISAYRSIFEHIRDEPDEPLIIHCTAGKDRTGVICALILLTAGVDSNTIAR